MIEKLIRNSGCEYDEEIIKYGLITLCHGMLTMLILFILGILSNRVWETVLYLLNSFFCLYKDRWLSCENISRMYLYNSF